MKLIHKSSRGAVRVAMWNTVAWGLLGRGTERKERMILVSGDRWCFKGPIVLIVDNCPHDWY